MPAPTKKPAAPSVPPTEPPTALEAVDALCAALGETARTIRKLEVFENSVLYTTTANITRAVRLNRPDEEEPS